MSRVFSLIVCILAFLPGIAVAQPCCSLPAPSEPVRRWAEAGFRAGDLQLQPPPPLGASEARQALEAARWKLEHPLVTPDVRPVFPGDETVERSLQILRERQGVERFFFWLEAVRVGGLWDYKAHHEGGGRVWQDAGNFNYAATGLEVLPDSFFGWTVPKGEILLFGAGAVQVLTNVERSPWDPLAWCGSGAYCDNAEDSRVIREAVEWMEDYGLREFLTADPRVVTFEVNSILGHWRAEYELPGPSYAEEVAGLTADRAATELEESTAKDLAIERHENLLFRQQQEEQQRLKQQEKEKNKDKDKEKKADSQGPPPLLHLR